MTSYLKRLITVAILVAASPALAEDSSFKMDSRTEQLVEGWEKCLSKTFTLERELHPNSDISLIADSVFLQCNDFEDIIKQSLIAEYGDSGGRALATAYISDRKSDIFGVFLRFDTEHYSSSKSLNDNIPKIQYYDSLSDAISTSVETIDELISLERDSNRQCSGPGNALKTWVGCAARDFYDAALSNRDMCFGKEGQAGYEMEWHACGPDSLRTQ